VGQLLKLVLPLVQVSGLNWKIYSIGSIVPAYRLPAGRQGRQLRLNQYIYQFNSLTFHSSLQPFYLLLIPWFQSLPVIAPLFAKGGAIQKNKNKKDLPATLKFNLINSRIGL